MKVTRVDSPNQVKQVTTNETAIKAKAIEAFKAATPPPPQAPIPVDPNAISPENMSAVMPKTTVIDASTDNVADTNQAKASDETQESPKQSEPSKEPDVSTQYQLLARKERQLRARAQQQEQSLKAEREKFLNDKAQLEARIKELETNSIPRQKLKERAFETLIEEGVSYDEITQQAADSLNKNPRYEAYINKLEAKLAAMEEKLTKAEVNQAEAANTQYQAALKQIRTDVNSLVSKDPNFETIKVRKAEKEVVKLIERVFKEEGELLSVEEAAELVENHLIEDALSFTKINKIKSRLNPTVQSSKTEQQKPQPQQIQTMKTLTNAASSTRTLSAKERAILAFKGELKS